MESKENYISAQYASTIKIILWYMRSLKKQSKQHLKENTLKLCLLTCQLSK